MKKLLAFAASISALAMTAGADDGLKSWADFEGYGEKAFSAIADDTGDAGGTYIYWSGANDDGNVITAYGEAGQTAARPDVAAEANNTKYLKVDSTSGITRNINAGDHAAESLDAPVYFDMDVQFTVSDQVAEPAEGEGDKLLVWLYGTEDMEAPTLIVTAADVNANLEATKYNFVVTTGENGFAIAADEWHRLTIVADSKEVVPGADVPFFSVYVDGKQVKATATLAKDGTVTAGAADDAQAGLFGSLVEFDGGKDSTYTITSATFQGSGALDDLVITLDTPAFLAPTYCFQVGETPYTTFAAALDAVAADGTVQVLAAPAEALNVTKSITLDLNGVDVDKDVTVAAEAKLVLANTSETAATVTKVLVDGELDVNEKVLVTTVDTATGVVKAKVTANITNTPDGAAWSADADDSGYYTLEMGSSACTFSITGSNFVATYAVGTEDGEDIVYGEPEAYAEPLEALEEPVMLKVVITPAQGYKIDRVTGYGEGEEPTVEEGVYTFEFVFFDASIALTVTTSSEGGSEGKTIDGGDGDITVSDDVVAAAATKAGKTADTVTDAEILAYIVGGTVEDDEVKLPTPTITIEDGKVKVALDADADTDNFDVTYTLYKKASLTEDWPDEGEKFTGTMEEAVSSDPSQFYQLKVTVSNK